MAPALGRVGEAAASTGIPPSAWTAIGLACAAVASLFFGFGAWYLVILGGLALLVSGFLDVIDGQVARIMRKETKAGAFLDSISDKVGEAAVFVGILVGGLASPYLVLIAALLSLLVSYSRSRAESLGVDLAGVGIGERAERLLIVAVAAIVGGVAQFSYAIEYAMVLVCIVSGITLVQRVAGTLRALRA